jgi:hypothetical protein
MTRKFQRRSGLSEFRLSSEDVWHCWFFWHFWESRRAEWWGPQKPLTRADTADVFRLRSEVLAPVDAF